MSSENESDRPVTILTWPVKWKSVRPVLTLSPRPETAQEMCLARLGVEEAIVTRCVDDGNGLNDKWMMRGTLRVLLSPS